MKRLIVLIVTLVTACSSAPLEPGRAEGNSTLALGTAKPPEELSVRTETKLGVPACPSNQLGKPHCNGPDGDWLSTKAASFVPIKKRAYLRGTYEAPQGVQMASRFLIESESGNAAVTFSAETYLAKSKQRMYVRVLIDGVPANPDAVVFAEGTNVGTRTFTFTSNLKGGLHVAQVEWHVDAGAKGYMRNAALSVRTGRPSAKGHEGLEVSSTSTTVTKSDPTWAYLVGSHQSVYVNSGDTLTVTFSADAQTSGGKRIFVRAIVDGMPAAPSDVLFATDVLQATQFTFGQSMPSTGWHDVHMEWAVDGDTPGTATLGPRTVVSAAFPSPDLGASHPFYAAPSGPNTAIGNIWFPFVSIPINVPASGNGEISATFSAEVVADGDAEVYAVMGLDNVFPSVVTAAELKAGGVAPHARAHVFSQKRVSAGPHTLQIWVTKTGAAGAWLGDRTLAAITETAFVPDLAVAPTFGTGLVGTNDRIDGIEPAVGTREVLAILADARRCDGPGAPSPCIDQDDLSPSEVEDALVGPGPESVKSFYEKMSNGRFSIHLAATLGWLTLPKPASYYWGPNPKCVGSSFQDAQSERFADTIQAAIDAGFDFTKYDKNSDGRVDSNELAIVLVYPQTNVDGSGHRMLYASQCPSNVPFVQNGVELPSEALEWETSLDPDYEDHQFTTAAHELMHLFLGLDDMYDTTNYSTMSGPMSLMSSNRGNTTHLDAAYKLALGWVTPVVVPASGTVNVDAVATGGSVIVLPRQGAAFDEYFLIENRTYLGASSYDEDRYVDDGLAVWQVVSDQTSAMQAPIGTTQAVFDTVTSNMGRKAIRLIRAWDTLKAGGTADVTDTAEIALWSDADYDLVSGACPPVPGSTVAVDNTLTWFDCAASGYSLRNFSAASEHMTVDVTVP